MTEQQIEGCKLLAEIEGLTIRNTTEGGTLIVNEGKKIGVRNYTEDWNNLMRVAHLIEKHGFIVEISLCIGKTCQIFKPGTRFTYQSNDAKLSVFECLVEAAMWIKQHGK